MEHGQGELSEPDDDGMFCFFLFTFIYYQAKQSWPITGIESWWERKAKSQQQTDNYIMETINLQILVVVAHTFIRTGEDSALFLLYII